MRTNTKLTVAVVLLGTAALADTYISDTWHKTINPLHMETGTYIEGVEAAAPGSPSAGRVRLYAKSGAPGEWCSKDDAGVETCMSAGGGGGGEANTASNLGGGLANWDSKVGVDLRFNSFAAADFNLAANLISIDTATWATDAEVAASYQPLDGDLTSIAALVTTAHGRGLLDDADAAASRTSIGAAASGAIGSSGLTMNTSRLLGRTTAAVGAPEEITVSAPLTLSALALGLTQNAGTDVTADLEEETHATEHQHGGTDEVATATPGANVIPKAGAGSTLADGFVDGLAEADEVVGTETDEALCSWEATGARVDCDLTPDAGTNIAADLEEETHAAEHSQGAADPVTAENLASACTLGQTLEGDGTGGVVCATDDGGAGGSNSVEVTLDFGASGSDVASVVVTGQAWVASGSEIVCAPTLAATADRAEAAEDAVLEGLVVAPHTRVVATGFTLTGAPRFGRAIGKYAVHCVGV